MTTPEPDDSFSGGPDEQGRLLGASPGTLACGLAVGSWERGVQLRLGWQYLDEADAAVGVAEQGLTGLRAGELLPRSRVAFAAEEPQRGRDGAGILAEDEPAAKQMGELVVADRRRAGTGRRRQRAALDQERHTAVD